ncbi:MAG: Beta-lactamase domain protein [Promethearchaeota archaeon]|nr:MAG: Beta-lactamase domain protein [Candidatus Lokiarchaeota archaeon]
MFSGSNSIKKGTNVVDNLYYFSENQMLDCNQYAIYNEESDEIVLFDAGNGRSLNGLIKGMKELDLSPEKISKIYLTHEHVDHVIGVYPFLKSLNSNVEIYAYGETADILRNGDESKIFPGNLGIKASMFGLEVVPIDVSKLKESDKVKIGTEFTFEIYHTPGHSEGSISYYDPNNKILIPGDLVFTGGSFGRFDFPGGDLKTLQDSIRFVNDLDVKYLLPGHMGIASNGNEQIRHSLRMVQSMGSYF